MHKAWRARARKIAIHKDEKKSARMELQAEHHNEHVAMRPRDQIARRRLRIVGIRRAEAIASTSDAAFVFRKPR